jgi:hypothetical protein
MPLTQLAPPYPIFTDKNGDPLDAGYLYFGTINLNPETNPIQVYYDSALTQPAAQPLRTSNGYVMRNGSPALIYANSQFSVTVRNKNNELVIYSPVGFGIIPGTPYSTDQVVYNEGSTSAVDRILTARLQDYVSVKDFGAVGDGVTDDTAAIQAAANSGASKLWFPQGTYNVTQGLNLRYVGIDATSATIAVQGTGSVGIYLGMNANISGGYDQKFFRILRTGYSGAETAPTVRVLGCKSQLIDIRRVDFIQFYADVDVGTDYSIAYSSFYIGAAVKLDISTNPSPTDIISKQWINENRVYLNRVTGSLTVGGATTGNQTINHNVFIGGTFESTASLTFVDSWSNHLENMRFEGSPTLSFDASSFGNTVEIGWAPNSTNMLYGTDLTVTDNGQANFVFTKTQAGAEKHEEILATVEEPQFNNSAYDGNSRKPDLTGLKTRTNSNDAIVFSDKLKVEPGNLFFMNTTTTSATPPRYRSSVYFYDQDGAAYTATDGVDYSSATFSGNGSSLTLGTGVANASIVILAGSGIKYLAMTVNGSTGQQASQTAREVVVGTYRDRNENLISLPFKQTVSKNSVTAVPSQSWCPVGFQVVRNDGAFMFTCSFALQTTGTGSSGSTSLVVADATGVLTSDIIGVVTSSTNTEWYTVSGVVGTTITLSSTLPNAVSGAKVVFNRWKTTAL